MCAECVARQLWRSDLTPCLRDIAKKRRRKRWSSSWTAGYRWSKFALVLQSTFALQCCWFGVVWKVERIVCVVSGVHEKFLLMPFSSRKLQRIEQFKKKDEVHSWRKMGYKEESLQSKVLYLFGMKLNVWILQRRNPKDVWDNEKCPSVHSVWWNLNSPCLSFALEKDGFRTVILVQFQWCLYIYICIYMFISRPILTVAIASFKFLDL